MKKLANNSMLLHATVARQPATEPTLSPQRPQSRLVPLSQQPNKSQPQSSRQLIQDIPLPDPNQAAGPIHDDIARRAYEIYIERGCPQGQSEQIWRQAELELRYKHVAALHAKSHQ